MIINIFHGVVLNAAVGVASQVNTAIYSFVSNFQTSFTPQLIKTYSSGELENHRLLISRATRFSFFLLLVIVLPVIFNINTILGIWLVEVPPYSSSICVYILVFSLIDSANMPLWTSIQAIGNIRNYQIMVSTVNMLSLPAAYVMLRLGMAPDLVFVIRIVIVVIHYLIRIFYILPKIQYPVLRYLRFDTLSLIVVSMVGCFAVHYCGLGVSNPYWRIAVGCVVSLTAVPLAACCVGCTNSERKMVARLARHPRNSIQAIFH